VASLEAARDSKSPIILQMSQGGAAYFAGKGVDNKDQSASIQGAIAGAHYIRAIAPAYGIPVVLHTDHCAKKLLPWLDGMLDEDEKFFKSNGKSSHIRIACETYTNLVPAHSRCTAVQLPHDRSL
jgi:fructose-bisphosphate aldolase class II